MSGVGWWRPRTGLANRRGRSVGLRPTWTQGYQGAGDSTITGLVLDTRCLDGLTEVKKRIVVGGSEEAEQWAEGQMSRCGGESSSI
jgi:hypothetical protein